MAYLAWQSRGWRRVASPLLAAAVAGGVYIAINPVMILWPGKWPWDVGLMIIARRVDVVHRYARSFGMASVGQIVGDSLYWWPILPLAIAAAWSCRREKWFAPVALFATFSAGGTVAALFRSRMLQGRYMAPAEMGLFFLVSVCLVTISSRADAAYRQARESGVETASAP
jgi:hypothetical protein